VTFQSDDLHRDGPRQSLRRLAAPAAEPEPSTDADDGPRRQIPADPVSFDQRVYAAVSLIPAGRLATYGQIAELIGAWGCARQVGWALRRLPLPSPVPWQRVVNAAGRIAMTPSREGSDWIQRELLLAEGIPVEPDGRLPLARFRWCPEILPPMAAAQSPPQI
jgi:methylated-DNA-protein-cysteine methyltransferase-like protein